MSGERPEERWNPTQSPETILLSVLSMLADPNISSPANVDASVQWRKDKDGYTKKIKELINLAKKDLPEDFEMPKPKKKIEIPFEEEGEIDNIDDVEFEPNDEIQEEDNDAKKDQNDAKKDEEIKEEVNESDTDSEIQEKEGMDKVKKNLKNPREQGKKKKINIQIEETPLPTTSPTPQPKDTPETNETPIPIKEEPSKPESTIPEKTVELYKEVSKKPEEESNKQPEEPKIEKLKVEMKPSPKKQQCCTIL